MNQSSNAWVLAVTDSSLATGRRELELPTVGSVVIGQSIENDLVLRALKDKATRVSLTCERPYVHVEVVSGAVSSESTEYNAGDSFALTPAGFSIESMQLNVDGVLAPMLDENEISHSDNSDIEPILPVAQHDVSTAWWQGRYSMVAGVALMASVALLGWQVSAFSEKTAADPVTVMERYVAENELKHVELSTRGETLTLEGRVDERSEYVALERYIAVQSMTHEVDMLVMDGQSVRGHIEDLFRINGVSSTTNFDDEGMLWVNTSVSDPSILENLRNVVSSDMPSLDQWDIANTPPKNDAPRGPADPGKQVAMVVSDEPAFVLTADQTRYFVGSLLPTGHRISAIEGGRVVLEKDGEASELEF